MLLFCCSAVRFGRSAVLLVLDDITPTKRNIFQRESVRAPCFTVERTNVVAPRRIDSVFKIRSREQDRKSRHVMVIAPHAVHFRSNPADTMHDHHRGLPSRLSVPTSFPLPGGGLVDLFNRCSPDRPADPQTRRPDHIPIASRRLVQLQPTPSRDHEPNCRNEDNQSGVYVSASGESVSSTATSFPDNTW